MAQKLVVEQQQRFHHARAVFGILDRVEAGVDGAMVFGQGVEGGLELRVQRDDDGEIDAVFDLLVLVELFAEQRPHLHQPFFLGHVRAVSTEIFHRSRQVAEQRPEGAVAAQPEVQKIVEIVVEPPDRTGDIRQRLVNVFQQVFEPDRGLIHGHETEHGEAASQLQCSFGVPRRCKAAESG